MIITILDALTALAAAVASRIVRGCAALQPYKCGADDYRCFVHPAGSGRCSTTAASVFPDSSVLGGAAHMAHMCC
jgi:hypothetical protein